MYFYDLGQKDGTISVDIKVPFLTEKTVKLRITVPELSLTPFSQLENTTKGELLKVLSF